MNMLSGHPERPVGTNPVDQPIGSEAFDLRLIPGRDYTHYVSLDQGYNNPTAIMFHAVHKKNGNVVTYGEHYRREMTVEQHVEALKGYEKFLRDNLGVVPELRIADPAIKQRQQVTGLSIQIEYSMLDINWATGVVRDINAGLDKMNNYLRLNKWFITENCINLIKEMKKYRRADYTTQKLRDKNNRREEPQKKDDHAIDSCRYFFSFQPDMNPNKIPVNTVRPTFNPLGTGTTRIQEPHQMLDPMFQRNMDTTIHVVTDEYVGEW